MWVLGYINSKDNINLFLLIIFSQLNFNFYLKYFTPNLSNHRGTVQIFLYMIKRIKKMKVISSKRNEISFFDDIIKEKGTYDFLDENFYESFLRLTELNNLPSGLRILDLGCGSGAWGVRIAELGYKVTGIDISSKMVKAAFCSTKDMKVDFSPICADAERMPFKNKSFDCVFFGFSLHHIPNISLTFKEALRCLKDSGRIILIDPNGSNPVRQISNAVGKIINLISSVKYSSPSERPLSINNICKNLKQNKFKDIKISLYFNLVKDIKSSSNLLINLRHFLLIVACKLLPQYMGATDFVIIAEKGRKNMY